MQAIQWNKFPFFGKQIADQSNKVRFCEDTMKLEKMDAFFTARLDGYDEHMLTEIEGATEFYPYTASLLPLEHDAVVLDLGCGTGLELEYYLALNREASVVGIDLSSDMLSALKRKFADRKIRLICGSYFDVPFQASCFDAAVSVESFHHFTAAQKLMLYRKLKTALTDHGYFVLTDYFAESEEAEQFYVSELTRLKREQGLDPAAFYHYDTPLTVEHETEVLKKAGFSDVQIMRNWKVTYTILAR